MTNSEKRELELEKLLVKMRLRKPIKFSDAVREAFFRGALVQKMIDLQGDKYVEAGQPNNS